MAHGTWSAWLIIFFIIACLLIIGTLVASVVYVFIDRKRTKALNGTCDYLKTNLIMNFQKIILLHRSSDSFIYLTSPKLCMQFLLQNQI